MYICVELYLRVYSFCGYTFLWISTKMKTFVHANKLNFVQWLVVLYKFWSGRGDVEMMLVMIIVLTVVKL